MERRHLRTGNTRVGPAFPFGGFPLRFPLAFDGVLLGQVLRIFTDTVSSW